VPTISHALTGTIYRLCRSRRLREKLELLTASQSIKLSVTNEANDEEQGAKDERVQAVTKKLWSLTVQEVGVLSRVAKNGPKLGKDGRTKNSQRYKRSKAENTKDGPQENLASAAYIFAEPSFDLLSDSSDEALLPDGIDDYDLWDNSEREDLVNI
jgi:hypothetical protein